MTGPLRILITAGSTREAIDPVRFIANRSSGKMGVALVNAAQAAGHAVTLIAGAIAVAVPDVRRIDVESAADMRATVIQELPGHDVLVMAAAVADFRPVRVSETKLSRSGSLSIECEPTADIVADAAGIKSPSQMIVSFSLEAEENVERARAKMLRKSTDLMVFNALSTMGSDQIRATLLSPIGPDKALPILFKERFAALLMNEIAAIHQNLTASRG